MSQRSDVKFYTSSKATGTILHTTLYQCRAYFTSVHVAETKMDWNQKIKHSTRIYFVEKLHYNIDHKVNSKITWPPKSTNLNIIHNYKVRYRNLLFSCRLAAFTYDKENKFKNRLIIIVSCALYSSVQVIIILVQNAPLSKDKIWVSSDDVIQLNILPYSFRVFFSIFLGHLLSALNYVKFLSIVR